MSTTSKIALSLAISGSAGIVYFVHWSQQNDRVRLRQGVIYDIQRQERKRLNLDDLKEQQRLTETLSKSNSKS